MFLFGNRIRNMLDQIIKYWVKGLGSTCNWTRYGRGPKALYVKGVDNKP